MASQAPTAFVLIPGSFCFPLVYHKVTQRLRAKSHKVTEISLLTCVQDRDSDSARPAATLYQDAAIIKKAIEEWADKGYDVVVAANSYGGFPVTESLKGLGKPERAQGGLEGGVVGLVMLASFLPDSGETVESGEYMELDKEGGGKWIFNGLSEEDANHYMSKIGYHSRQSYSDAVTYPGWKYIPTTYLSTSQDYGLPPVTQKRMFEAAKKKGADIKLVGTDGDHVPMLSVPDDVTRVLLEAAGRF
ncbi:hypothetical protein AK830_g6423 [Neonectria ditissima]|uniref:AB hydrolase-1 domain-containing protein n=1 Tax=Neonectria ditissima TaxID=78410 RepID=A0A0P7B209_9HYPO|nr:hypothetical protein AK830_g6423 [Neonectria ditissima]